LKYENFINMLPGKLKSWAQILPKIEFTAQYLYRLSIVTLMLLVLFYRLYLGAVDLSRLIFVRNKSVLIAANAMQLSHSKSLSFNKE